MGVLQWVPLLKLKPALWGGWPLLVRYPVKEQGRNTASLPSRNPKSKPLARWPCSLSPPQATLYLHTPHRILTLLWSIHHPSPSPSPYIHLSPVVVPIRQVFSLSLYLPPLHSLILHLTPSFSLSRQELDFHPLAISLPPSHCIAQLFLSNSLSFFYPILTSFASCNSSSTPSFVTFLESLQRACSISHISHPSSTYLSRIQLCSNTSLSRPFHYTTVIDRPSPSSAVSSPYRKRICLRLDLLYLAIANKLHTTCLSPP